MTTTSHFAGARMVTISFLVLMGAFGLNLSAGQFFAPLHDAHGWPLSTLSIAVSVNMLVWGVLQPFLGRLVDRIGPRPVIAASAALMGVAFLLSATIEYRWQFFLYYGVLTAVGFAGCGSMANAVLVSRWYVAGRAKMLARSSMGINIGQLLLLPLAGWLIFVGGTETAFAVLGAAMLVVVVPAVIVGVRNDPGDVGQTPDGGGHTADGAKGTSASFGEAMQSLDFWCATLGFVTCGYSLYMVAIHLPGFAVDLGGSKALGGTLLGIAAGASAVSMWVLGQLAPRSGKKAPLIGLYVVRAGALAWLAGAHEIWQLYVFALVYGAASIPIIPLKTGLIGDRFGAGGLGAILGTAWFVHQIFAAVGVYVGGAVRESAGTYGPAFASAAVLLVIGAAATVAFRGVRAAGPVTQTSRA
ncbi:MFS transporter [Arhodomonas sp. AD133]|uniref:MFS transporter n=1 Tax=Arhodomonas sp. AD133 TaxID=3415009 RepID=UPI003EC130F8